jgi:hypothetical protein
MNSQMVFHSYNRQFSNIFYHTLPLRPYLYSPVRQIPVLMTVRYDKHNSVHGPFWTRTELTRKAVLRLRIHQENHKKLIAFSGFFACQQDQTRGQI